MSEAIRGKVDWDWPQKMKSLCQDNHRCTRRQAGGPTGRGLVKGRVLLLWRQIYRQGRKGTDHGERAGATAY